MENTQLNDIRLSPHFMLTEFLNLGKHPDNLPTPQVLFNLKYGCQYLLDTLWLSSPLHPNWVLQMKKNSRFLMWSLLFLL